MLYYYGVLATARPAQRPAKHSRKFSAWTTRRCGRIGNDARLATPAQGRRPAKNKPITPAGTEFQIAQRKAMQAKINAAQREKSPDLDRLVAEKIAFEKRLRGL